MKKTLSFGLLPAIAIFLLTVSLLPGCGNVDNDEILKKDGVKALGHIRDGSGKSGKYSEFFDIIVEYNDENGTLLTVNKSVTRGQFDSYSKDQQVLLVYSKKNPSIIKILSTPEEVLEFTGIKERDMAIADLNGLLTMKKQNIDSCLNTINYGWEKKDSDSAWINERKHQFLRLFPSEKTIIYVSDAKEYERFQNLAKQAGFHDAVTEVAGGAERKTFENDSLFMSLVLNREMKERKSDNPMVPYVTQEEVVLCVVTLRKK